MLKHQFTKNFRISGYAKDEIYFSCFVLFCDTFAHEQVM